MPSFDVVSKVQWNEVDNALNQASKEISQRFDFKDTETELERTPDGITVRSSSDDRLKAAIQVLHDPQEVGGASRQPVGLTSHQGIAAADEP